jgi:hypothetical protein
MGVAAPAGMLARIAVSANVHGNMQTPASSLVSLKLTTIVSVFIQIVNGVIRHMKNAPTAIHSHCG